LTRNFSVTRFSNRGTGDSDKPSEQPTIRMMADDTIALLDTLGIQRPHICGISMGGFIGQEIAINYPNRVNGLVLGCTAVGGPAMVRADAATNASMTPDPSLPVREMIRKSWYALVSDEFVKEGHDFLEGMIESIVSHPTPMDTIVKQVMAIAGHNVAERDGAITAPTLVIHGDADRLVPPVNGDQVAAAIRGAERRAINGVGHMFFWERPEESARIITEFLSRVPARA
jgi:pimeloyl-ACP methyl ester carboxylesterase